MTKYQKAQQSFWKSSELICVSLLSSYEAHKPIFDHLLFVLFLISLLLEILRVKMSLLTEGSRESLSSLFDPVFSSFVLILSQKACGKSPGSWLKFSLFLEKCPGHFLADFLHYPSPEARAQRSPEPVFC